MRARARACACVCVCSWFMEGRGQEIELTELHSPEKVLEVEAGLVLVERLFSRNFHHSPGSTDTHTHTQTQNHTHIQACTHTCTVTQAHTHTQQTNTHRMMHTYAKNPKHSNARTHTQPHTVRHTMFYLFEVDRISSLTMVVIRAPTLSSPAQTL